MSGATHISNDTPKLTPADWFTEMRTVIESATEAESALERKCDACGMALALIRGRRTGKWWYVHKHLTECSPIGTRIFFDTRERAESTKNVFRIPKPQTMEV